MTNSPRGILWAEWINPPTPYFVNGSPRQIFPNIPGNHRHWIWVYPDRKTMLLTPRSFDLGEPHHVTLQYGVEKSTVDRLIGKRFIATLTELRQDDRAQAFRVVLPDDIAPFWKGDTIPHLTVSYKEYPVHGGKAALDGEVTGSNPIDVEFAINFHEFQPKE